MQHLVEDITNKIQTCATLMSDPKILRFHSPLVASAFTTAFNAIEQLQTLIPSKPEKLCECGAQQLVDSSIIKNGIKQLVSLALKKQLEPLIKPLPKIVLKDFKSFQDAPHAADDENLVEREIKETNCMASIVLLYYYMQWHAVLILINSKIRGSLDRLEDEQLLQTIAKLPKGADLLEFRYLQAAFEQVPGDGTAERKTAVESLQTLHILPLFMTNDAVDRTDKFRNRKTKLITLYRRAIEKILGSPQNNTQFIKDDDLASVLSAVQNEFAYNTTSLFGGVFSSFHVHDGTQKWEDMNKKLNSQTQDKEGRTAAYQFHLQHVLSQRPYAADIGAFKTNAVPLCIHDYNNSSLMADIVKSSVHLADLIVAIQTKQADAIPQALFKLSSQFYAADPKALSELDKDDYKDKGFQHTHFKDFIAEAHNSFRASNGALPYANKRLTVDDFPAYYVGSAPVNLHNANHVYLALPGLELDPDDTPFIKRIQLLTRGKQDAEVVLSLDTVKDGITPFVRNSLYTQYGIASILALLEGTKHATSLDLAGEYRYPAAGLFQAMDGNPTIKDLKRSDIISLLQKERDAYQQYLRQYSLQRPKLIPGISWPVSYTDVTGPKNNNAVFDLVRHVPKQWLGTTQEMVQQLHEISTKLPAPP